MASSIIRLAIITTAFTCLQMVVSGQKLKSSPDLATFEDNQDFGDPGSGDDFFDNNNYLYGGRENNEKKPANNDRLAENYDNYYENRRRNNKDYNSRHTTTTDDEDYPDEEYSGDFREDRRNTVPFGQDSNRISHGTNHHADDVTTTTTTTRSPATNILEENGIFPLESDPLDEYDDYGDYEGEYDGGNGDYDEYYDEDDEYDDDYDYNNAGDYGFVNTSITEHEDNSEHGAAHVPEATTTTSTTVSPPIIDYEHERANEIVPPTHHDQYDREHDQLGYGEHDHNDTEEEGSGHVFSDDEDDLIYPTHIVGHDREHEPTVNKEHEDPITFDTKDPVHEKSPSENEIWYAENEDTANRGKFAEEDDYVYLEKDIHISEDGRTEVEEDILFISEGGAGGEMDGTVQIVTHSDDSRYVSILAQPGMLAALIGGAVVGLLVAILLVMFVVYRMRKKDEGSYPLDEPKRLPLTSSYANTDKEIYA